MTDRLPSLAPDTSRNARTIERCHDRLERRRASAQSAARYVIERNALLGFGVIYLASLAFDVVHVFTRYDQ
jgi:hypothetical protein